MAHSGRVSGVTTEAISALLICFHRGVGHVVGADLVPAGRRCSANGPGCTGEHVVLAHITVDEHSQNTVVDCNNFSVLSSGSSARRISPGIFSKRIAGADGEWRNGS